MLTVAGAILLLAVAAIATLAWRASRVPSLGDRDTLLVSFENRTGEPVFDDALRLALTIQLEQSPHLRVVPEQRVREALAFMKRSPDEPVPRALAMDLCARVGARAVLTGTINRLGGYVIGLEGAECPSGRTVVRRQLEVARRDDVIAGLGRMASELRTTLGESVASVQQFDVPLAQATTPSLEALRALSAGDLARRRGHDVEALEAYQRAIDIDPQFALAHGRLGVLLLSQDEIAAGRGSVSVRVSLLQIAFAEGDAAAMQRQVEWAAANPAAESVFATQRASMAMCGGRLKDGGEMWRRRVSSAEARGDRTLAALTTAGAAIHEALVGDEPEVKRLTTIALERPDTPDTVLRSAFALAVIGHIEAADTRFTQYLAMPDVEAGSDPQYRAATQALMRGRASRLWALPGALEER